MALDNAEKMVGFIEMLAGKAGVNRDEINRDLIFEVINSRLKDFTSRTGVLETSSTISTVANQQEYELPNNRSDLKIVTIDGLRTHKISFDQVDYLTENIT